MGTDIEKIGIIGETIVNKFNLDISPNTPIYIGLNNRIHMENSHGDIYRNFSDCIGEIINSPDYVGVNPHDDSLEYYKNYGDIIIHIKLAVRATNKGVFFAKTLYEINSGKLQSYLNKGRIKPI